MITSKKVFEMLAVFDVLPESAFEEDAFDMGQPSVCNYFQGYFKLEKAHECGTVHCFAGWFLVAKHFNDIKNGKFFRGKYSERFVYYTSGMGEIMEHFLSDQHLNPYVGLFPNVEIWGNRKNGHLFTSPEAYTPKNKDFAESLQDVLDHWCEVGLRLYIQELYDGGKNDNE